MKALRRSIYVSAVLIGTVTIALNIAALSFIHPILTLLQIPDDIYQMMYDYLWIIFGESALLLSIISMPHYCVPSVMRSPLFGFWQFPLC